MESINYRYSSVRVGADIAKECKGVQRSAKECEDNPGFVTRSPKTLKKPTFGIELFDHVSSVRC